MAAAPSSWPQFARVLRKQELMDEMMETQGVDLVAAVRAGDGFVKRQGELPRLHATRQHAGPGSWSRSGEQAEFCPNGEFFASLKS